jgi:hypothetical protein
MKAVLLRIYERVGFGRPAREVGQGSETFKGRERGPSVDLQEGFLIRGRDATTVEGGGGDGQDPRDRITAGRGDR